MIVQTAAILAGAIYNAPQSEIFARGKRKPNVSLARRYAFKLCRERGMTYAQIGEAFGLDETSIRKSLKKDA